MALDGFIKVFLRSISGWMAHVALVLHQTTAGNTKQVRFEGEWFELLDTDR